MEVYFNWLGEWIKLDNDEDLINDIDPVSFIVSSIKLNETKEIMLYEEILTITKKRPLLLYSWKFISVERKKKYPKYTRKMVKKKTSYRKYEVK